MGTLYGTILLRVGPGGPEPVKPTFSVTLKSSERTENEQMSSPDPAMEVKPPPTKPVATSAAARQAPQTPSPKS